MEHNIKNHEAVDSGDADSCDQCCFNEIDCNDLVKNNPEFDCFDDEIMGGDNKHWKKKEATT